jgi:nucleotide-binding universal stress UspA family protein
LKEGLKILVAFDGSTEAAKAVEVAADIADRFAGAVTVLNVYWDPAQERYEPEIERIEQISVGDEGSLRILQDIEPILEEKKVKYELKTVRNPNVPKTIMRIAEDEGYGIIALGSRGMGGAKAWLLGSVSSRVIAEAHCPVIVV